MSPRKATGSRRPPRRRSRGRREKRRAGRVLLSLLAILVLAASAYTLYLDHTLRERFEGRRWELAARVFGRPLELYAGAPLSADALELELRDLRYRFESSTAHPGTYRRDGSAFQLRTRPFAFWDGDELSRVVRIAFGRGRVREIRGAEGGLLRLDPPLIGSLYPAHREDRLLVRLEDVPAALPEALIAVEDQRFRDHPGIDPEAIGRALVANLRAGEVVQGGSTLTQQLVKNFFLSAERTLWRKANEAVMALLLEIHYEKDEILEAYLNEIYLGQQAERAIHGVGLASFFYFDRPVAELDLPRIALLVALVRGPSYYDPRRHPERARERRNLVLTILAERGIASAEEVASARRAPLGVTPVPPAGATPYPAFMDLVHRELRRDYREEDLRSEGLRVFTTLDPLVQQAAEGALAKVAGGAGDPTLEGAVVLTRRETGDVLALVGGREARFEGFNRALEAHRPVGSLIKPAVYLTALERPPEYTLASLVDDGPVRVEQAGGRVWAPQNFDRVSHGSVTLYEALVHSYNQATVRLGLSLGPGAVRQTLERLGLTRSFPVYPSLLLGAVELSPWEVAQIYQTLADGGFRTPLRGIREVLAADGTPLQRYPISVEQVVEPGPAYLIDWALQGVVREGTAAGLVTTGEAQAAGKTGTTDDLRDSWYAGYTGDWVAVVWVGRDDNAPAGLTGASGAMRVWEAVLHRIGARGLNPEAPPGVEYAWVDPETGLRTSQRREGALRLPFITGSEPPLAKEAEDPSGFLRSVVDWIRGRRP